MIFDNMKILYLKKYKNKKIHTRARKNNYVLTNTPIHITKRGFFMYQVARCKLRS